MSDRTRRLIRPLYHDCIAARREELMAAGVSPCQISTTRTGYATYIKVDGRVLFSVVLRTTPKSAEGSGCVEDNYIGIQSVEYPPHMKLWMPSAKGAESIQYVTTPRRQTRSGQVRKGNP